MRTKTLGQIAHETGERAGSWARKWEHMHHSQRMEWEALADAVAAVAAAEERERCAKRPLTDDDVLKMWRVSDFRGTGGQADWFAEGVRAAERSHGIGA